MLCDRPHQCQLLRNTPALGASAVGQTMRHSPFASSTLRTAAEGVELAGVTIGLACPMSLPSDFE